VTAAMTAARRSSRTLAAWRQPEQQQQQQGLEYRGLLGQQQVVSWRRGCECHHHRQQQQQEMVVVRGRVWLSPVSSIIKVAGPVTTVE